MKPRGGARDVFFFRNGHKISQVSEFHDDVSIATEHDEQSDKVFLQSPVVQLILATFPIEQPQTKNKKIQTYVQANLLPAKRHAPAH
jgi:hypothetical protein